MTKASRRGRRPVQAQAPRWTGTPSAVEALSTGLVRLARVTFATGLDAARGRREEATPASRRMSVGIRMEQPVGLAVLAVVRMLVP